MCCEKDSYYERQACITNIEIVVLLWKCISRWVDLAYDKYVLHRQYT